MSTRPFDPVQVLETLARHQVAFVLIGGVAVRMHGSNRVTNDTDICYARSSDNLERLAKALQAMNARRITDLEPEGVAVDVTPAYLEKEQMFAFMTDFGQVDLVAAPQGVEGFDDLAQGAAEVDIGATSVKLASVEALMKMKRARGWSVDRADLTTLSDIKQEQKSHPGGEAWR